LTGRASEPRRQSAGQSLAELTLVLPLLIVLFIAIADLSRAYSTMVAIESAAREAADWGAFQSSNWIGDPADPDSNEAKTIVEMIERACTAASTVPDYEGAADGSSCTNPTLTYELIGADPADPVGPGENCADPGNEPPCQVRVVLAHTFTLMVGELIPLSIQVPGGVITFPDEISFERDSVFAVSDLKLPEVPAP
jgi:Flp pilus assembly protein TadG